MTSARDAAQRLETEPPAIAGPDETHAGYGIMSQPFASGHVLALRRFVASSLGGAYTSVWHRTPEGAWTIHTDVEPRLSCPRYFGKALARVEGGSIRLSWIGPDELRVEVADRIDWTSRIDPSPATRAMSAMAGMMPARAWRSPTMLRAMGGMARVMLGSGPLRMRGTCPNGQWYRVAPRRVWRVVDARALIDGVDVGAPGPVEPQAALGEFLLPQRGIFAVGSSTFERTDR